MWNKEDKPRGTAANPTPASPQPSVASGGFHRERGEPMKEELASIGKSIIIKGELSGGEDLTIEGQVEGKIELRDHMLTIGPNGRIKAQIVAKSIVVLGQVTGNLTATDKVDIRENGSVEGDVASPRIAIADGSHFRGSIDMQRKDQPVSTDWPGVRKPETKAPMPVAAPVSDGRASA